MMNDSARRRAILGHRRRDRLPQRQSNEVIENYEPPTYGKRDEAWHEAGHAVVGLRLGCVLEYVTLEKAEERPYAHAEFRDYPSLEDEAIICYAGAFAMYLCSGARERPEWFGGWMHNWEYGTFFGDTQRMVGVWLEFLELAGQEERNVDREWELPLRQQAWDILMADLPKLSRLAWHLQRRRRLTGDECLTVLDPPV